MGLFGPSYELAHPLVPLDSGARRNSLEAVGLSFFHAEQNISGVAGKKYRGLRAQLPAGLCYSAFGSPLDPRLGPSVGSSFSL